MIAFGAHGYGSITFTASIIFFSQLRFACWLLFRTTPGNDIMYMDGVSWLKRVLGAGIYMALDEPQALR